LTKVANDLKEMNPRIEQAATEVLACPENSDPFQGIIQEAKMMENKLQQLFPEGDIVLQNAKQFNIELCTLAKQLAAKNSPEPVVEEPEPQVQNTIPSLGMALSKAILQQANVAKIMASEAKNATMREVLIHLAKCAN
jgi:hypothetical protein